MTTQHRSGEAQARIAHTAHNREDGSSNLPAATNRRGQTPFFYGTFAFLLIAGIALFFFFTNDRPLNILGEEGYNTYDALISGGTYNRNLWINDLTHACDGALGDLRTACLSHQPYASVNANGDTILIGPLYGTQQATTFLRTRDLRLDDFRFTAITNSYRAGPGAFLTPNGVFYTYAPTTYSGQNVQTQTAGVALTWDDYELGHYQITVNGQLAQEGNVPEGEEFWIAAAPKSADPSNSGSSTVGFQNARYRRVFGCDPKDGEVIASRTFIGPDTFTINDLDGFDRFCTQHPAFNLKNGISSSSKQVYYALAGGQSVQVVENQAWKIYYIANADRAGINLQCTGDAFDLDTERCTSLTGIADFCPADSQLENGVCVTTVENTIDLTDTVLVSAPDEFTFNTNYRNLKLGTKNAPIFLVEPPSYTCADSDPYGDGATWTYQDPSPDCYRTTINDYTIKGGQPVEVDGIFRVSIDNINGQFCNCEQIGENTYVIGGLRNPERWNAVYRVKLIRPIVKTTTTALSTLELGQSGTATLNIESAFSKPFDAIITIEDRAAITGETTIKRQNVLLTPGKNQIIITLPADLIGRHDITIRTFLDTPDTNILAGDAGTITYTVGDEIIENTTTTAQSWIAKLWSWITDLFRGD